MNSEQMFRRKFWISIHYFAFILYVHILNAVDKKYLGFLSLRTRTNSR